MPTDQTEILDSSMTSLGELLLRRRRIRRLGGTEVYEVKLAGEILMSSLLHASEEALADLALAELDLPALDVVIGGLGLGHTAAAALRDARVESLLVIELLESVIGWHTNGLVPLATALRNDPRYEVMHGDFFELAAHPRRGFDPEHAGRRFHAVLIDIDHSPASLLHSRHGRFYRTRGLRRLLRHLHPGGVFSLWSSEGPDERFLRTLDEVFSSSHAHVIRFPNPFRNNREAVNTVYVARAAGELQS